MRKKNIAFSAFSVTLMVLFFKFIGFIKQAVIAYFFGANLQTDAYFIAYGFVNSVIEIIVRSIGFSIIAIYSTILVSKGKEYTDKMISGILELLTPVFLALTGALCIFSPFIANILAPSYDASEISLISHFIYILSPLMLLCTIELIFGAVLDANKDFYIPRLQSFIYSIIIIIMCITTSRFFGIKSLIYGQYISSFIFMIVLLVGIKKYWKFSFVNIRNIPEIKSIIITAIPLFIGSGVIQLNQIVDKSIATSLGEGFASALSYCQVLDQFVTNIMIVNIGNVLFAHFSEYTANKEFDKLSDTLTKAINIIICLLIPISIITILYSKDIVKIVYFRGNFDTTALKLTSLVLIGYAVSFVFVGIRDLIIKSLYSLKNTFFPMLASIIAIIVNIFLSIFLSKRIGIIGISIATSVSALIGMTINALAFKKVLNIYKFKNNLITFLKNIPSIIILLIFILFINKFVSGIVGFIISSSIGLLMYALILSLFKVDEIVQIRNKVVKKVLKNNG